MAILFLSALREDELEQASFTDGTEDAFLPTLAHLLSFRGQVHGEGVQFFAGNVLRSQARRGFLRDLDRDMINYVRACALNATCAPSAKLRCTGAAVVIELACCISFHFWSDLFPTLLTMLSGVSLAEVDGAFAVLMRFCDTAPLRITSEAPGAELMIQKVITFLSSHSRRHREHALSIIVKLISPMICSAAIVQNADALIHGLTVKLPLFRGAPLLTDLI